ncbi:UNVERIFIED_CONTAM: hypothetical protein K2H54_044047 [Gekko kuhli]
MEGGRRRRLDGGGARVASCGAPFQGLSRAEAEEAAVGSLEPAAALWRRMSSERSMNRSQPLGEKIADEKKGPRRKLRMKTRVLIHHHT